MPFPGVRSPSAAGWQSLDRLFSGSRFHTIPGCGGEQALHHLLPRSLTLLGWHSEQFEKCSNLPECKPVSVPLRAAAIPLGQPLLTGSSELPESQAERAAPPPLFGLAPRGVYPAGRIAPDAVRSYRTFSPLPLRAVYFL